MFQKVIYKRQYNKPTIEEIEAEIADEPIPAEVKEPAPSKYKCSSKDIFKQLNEGAVYVPYYHYRFLSGNLSPRYLSVKPSKYLRTTKLTLKSDKVPGQSR